MKSLCVSKNYRTILLVIFVFGILTSALAASKSYTIVSTGQSKCYDDRGVIITPKPGDPFYGQDAQHSGMAFNYRDNGDGTISDVTTGLMWVKDRGQKMSWNDAVAGATRCRIGKYNDWRMPTIKELYSLIYFNGGCGITVDNSTPYIYTKYFDFKYGDVSRGVRIIDCQDWSSTQYISKTMNGTPTVFGVNFADGRIKGYPKVYPNGTDACLYIRYVRGNAGYGKNAFCDNGDGTITDNATGLMWQKNDSGKGMNWMTALEWVQKKNAEKLSGYSDWRLPDAKELQSIVDYTRAPAITDSAAISPVFQVTKLDDGEYPFFWSSTTHLDGPADIRGTAAIYIAFGRATGWMRFPPLFANQMVDVHGAGAQRSDPKSGDPAMYPLGRGPQGDVIRIYNFVRCVRDCNQMNKK